MTGAARLFAVHIGSLCYAFDKSAQKLDHAELEDAEPDCLEHNLLLATSLTSDSQNLR